MFLEELHLKHFKSHTAFDVNFTKRVSLICGANGSGKTNVFDALGLISRGKPFFAESDLRCIENDEGYFRVEGRVLTQEGDSQKILVFYEGSKKRIQLDDEEVLVGRWQSVDGLQDLAPSRAIGTPGRSQEERNVTSERSRPLDELLLGSGSAAELIHTI